MRFSELPLDPALLRGIDDMGFSEPTPIQEAALPPALQGRDLLAAAMTGSGKTAAFALPILQRLLRGPRGAVRALVLTPTRELAAQVHEHLASLGRHTPVTSTAVFGGVKPGPQIRALRGGVDVLIATPGRLLDHIGAGVARLDRVEIVVLDEADRMLDMGFFPAVREILGHLPRNRQTMLFSATLPEPIVTLGRTMLVSPVRIGVERKAAPASGVTHAVLPVPEPLKRSLLLEVLRRDEIGMVLVFTRTKHRANRLAHYLEGAGIACDRIHGNRSQPQRESALAGFKTGRLRVLVATDVASRGIDIEDLPHVVNFDVPVQPDDYIHRVGRTARAERSGHAITLVSPGEEEAMAAIERAIGRRLPRHHLDGFDYGARPSERFEVPIAERIAEIRSRRAEERARSRAKAEQRQQVVYPRRSGVADTPQRTSPAVAPSRGARSARPRRRPAA